MERWGPGGHGETGQVCGMKDLEKGSASWPWGRGTLSEASGGQPLKSVYSFVKWSHRVFP